MRSLLYNLIKNKLLNNKRCKGSKFSEQGKFWAQVFLYFNFFEAKLGKMCMLGCQKVGTFRVFNLFYNRLFGHVEDSVYLCSAFKSLIL
jgi:hypothetical protein